MHGSVASQYLVHRMDVLPMIPFPSGPPTTTLLLSLASAVVLMLIVVCVLLYGGEITIFGVNATIHGFIPRRHRRHQEKCMTDSDADLPNPGQAKILAMLKRSGNLSSIDLRKKLSYVHTSIAFHSYINRMNNYGWITIDLKVLKVGGASTQVSHYAISEHGLAMLQAAIEYYAELADAPLPNPGQAKILAMLKRSETLSSSDLQEALSYDRTSVAFHSCMDCMKNYGWITINFEVLEVGGASTSVTHYTITAHGLAMLQAAIEYYAELGRLAAEQDDAPPIANLPAVPCPL